MNYLEQFEADWERERKKAAILLEDVEGVAACWCFTGSAESKDAVVWEVERAWPGAHLEFAEGLVVISHPTGMRRVFEEKRETRVELPKPEPARTSEELPQGVLNWKCDSR